MQVANGVIDARESSIATLQQDLQAKQTQVKEFEKQVPELEVKVSSTEDQLNSTKQILDEKTSALSQARKHLRNAKERNMVHFTMHSKKMSFIFFINYVSGVREGSGEVMFYSREAVQC